MKTQLISLWDRIRGSYWFVPACFILVALALAAALPELDQRYATSEGGAPHRLTLGAESARTLLSTIAGVMATAVGLVFSLTILTLSIATSQFGPRLLRSFLNNGATQVVLGTFVATVIYSLLVLSMIRSPEEGHFVPQLSVYAAVLAGVFNLVFLVHFVNSIADLIQAPNVVVRVARDLDEALERLYPPRSDHEQDRTESNHESLTGPSVALRARKDGYLQGVDVEALTHAAAAAKTTLRMHVRPGQFVYLESPIAEAYGLDGDPDALEETVNRCIVTGHRRTPRQDAECALAELVELAVRALSAGVNDPFTAINCIDWLGASLGRAAQRDLPSSSFHDPDGAPRVVMPVVDFSALLDSGFNQIRQHGAGNAAVLIRLLEALAEVTRQIRRPADGSAVLRHVEMVARASKASIQEPEDLDDVQSRVTSIRSLLEALPQAGA